MPYWLEYDDGTRIRVPNFDTLDEAMSAGAALHERHGFEHMTAGKGRSELVRTGQPLARLDDGGHWRHL